MKIDMQLKPSDIVLLKVLACILILFFSLRFVIVPKIESYQNLGLERDEKKVEQEEMQYLIDSKDRLQKKIKQQQETLKEKEIGYYKFMENREVDELITGLILEHRLFPVYLNMNEPVAVIPTEYQNMNENQAISEVDAYVSMMNVTLNIQGDEEYIWAFMDDIAHNYDGIQVRSFSMNKSTYVNDQFQGVEVTNCNCVLVVYFCEELVEE